MSYYQNSYSAGDTFIDYSGNKYTVVTGGNTPSIPFDSSNIVNNKIVWGGLELTALDSGGSGISTWTAGTQYNIGDNVIKDNILYQCITANSDSTWTPAKWQKIGDDVFTGATSSANGEEGIVPTPTTSDISKFLCGDGTWKSTGGSALNVGRTLLWTGNILTSIPSSNPETLLNSCTDYDYLEFVASWVDSPTDTPYADSGYPSEFCPVLGTSFETDISFEVNLGANETNHNHLFCNLFFNTNTFYCDVYKYRGTSTAMSNGLCLYKIYGIKLYNPNNYSTTEQEIGKWIDGKKLYQKTITGTTPNTINADVVSATVSGMETMVSIDGWVKDDGNNFVPVLYTDINYVSEKNYVCIYVSPTGDIHFQVGHVSYTNKDFAITVKYTKV